MQQHELRPARGSKKDRKRVARGNASGQGTYAGRGLKGQQSRSGASIPATFEGGQTPLVRRLPTRRGFRNPFRVEYAPVNLRHLAKFPAGSDVTPDALREQGVVRSLRLPIKVLGDGDLSVALTVRTHRVSAAARAKIEAAGGSVEEITPRVPKPEKQRKKKAKAGAPKAEEKGEEPASDEQPAAEDQPSEEDE